MKRLALQDMLDFRQRLIDIGVTIFRKAQKSRLNVFLVFRSDNRQLGA